MLSFQAATTEMQEWMKTTLATGPRLGLFTSTSTLMEQLVEQLGPALARDQVVHRQKQVSATKYNYKQCTFTLVSPCSNNRSV